MQTAEQQGLGLSAMTDDELAEQLRSRGWVCYRKRPYMRRNRVRLRNGTVLVQDTVLDKLQEVSGDAG